MHIILSLLFAFSCGIIFPLQKLVVQEYTPIYAVSLRFVVTTLVALPFFRSTKGQLYKIFQASFFFMVGPFACQGFAMKFLDAGVCAMSTQIPPLLLIVWGAVFLGERFNRVQVGGLLLAIIGVCFVTVSPEISSISFLPTIALVVSIVSYTIGTLILRSIKLKPLQVMLWGYFFASFQLILLTSIFEKNFIKSFQETEGWAYGLSLVIGLISIGANALFTYLVSNYDLNKVMPFSLTLPFFSVLGGSYILGETLHGQAALGGVLVFAGVSIVMIKVKKKKVVL